MCPRGEHIFLLFLSSVHCFFAYIYDMPNETFTPHNIRNRPISQRGLPVQQIGFIALWCAFSLTNCPLFSGAPTYSAAPASASESFDGLISSRLEGSPTYLVHEMPHLNTSSKNMRGHYSPRVLYTEEPSRQRPWAVRLMQDRTCWNDRGGLRTDQFSIPTVPYWSLPGFDSTNPIVIELGFPVLCKQPIGVEPSRRLW